MQSNSTRFTPSPAIRILTVLGAVALVACADLATNPSGKTVSGARSLRDWDVEDTLGVEWLDTLGCASGWTVVNSLIVCNPDPRPNQDTLDSSAER